MLDIDYHTVMLDMHRKCAPGDQVVGWWSSGGGENPGSDALFQQFFTSQVEDGVYLQVDTALSGGRMAVKCYKAESMVLDEEEVATGFTEVPCKVQMEEAERVGTDLLKGDSEGLPSDMGGLEESVKRLQKMVETVYQYVDGVCSGRIEPNALIGQQLSSTLDSVPRLGKEAFERLYTDSMQDVLLLRCLSIVGQLCGIYFCATRDPALWNPVAWQLVFLVVNAFNLVQLGASSALLQGEPLV